MAPFASLLVGTHLAEGLTFESLYYFAQGKNLFREDDWGVRVLWSSLTLGLLHHARRIGVFAIEALGRRNWKRNLGLYRYPLLTGLIEEGLVRTQFEAAALFLVALLQQGIYTGDFRQIGQGLGETAFHIYVTLAALKFHHRLYNQFEVRLNQSLERAAEPLVREHGLIVLSILRLPDVRAWLRLPERPIDPTRETKPKIETPVEAESLPAPLRAAARQHPKAREITQHFPTETWDRVPLSVWQVVLSHPQAQSIVRYIVGPYCERGTTHLSEAELKAFINHPNVSDWFQSSLDLSRFAAFERPLRDRLMEHPQGLEAIRLFRREAYESLTPEIREEILASRRPGQLLKKDLSQAWATIPAEHRRTILNHEDGANLLNVVQGNPALWARGWDFLGPDLLTTRSPSGFLRSLEQHDLSRIPSEVLEVAKREPYPDSILENFDLPAWNRLSPDRQQSIFATLAERVYLRAPERYPTFLRKF